MKTMICSALALLATLGTMAQNTVIDISGNNTSSSYVTYDKSFSISKAKAVDVKMARYCYFSSTITGLGTLNLYAGGERCYLGTEKGKAWPNWNNYKGDIHIYPFKENSPSAGFFGVVLAHGGKSSSAENAQADVKAGKVNTSMQNNRVTLHAGATICCEANTAGAGFCIGELQTEDGSTLMGYMKKQRAAYYLLGGLGTDATLAGTIAPADNRDDTALGIVKEGQGTYRITGNRNYVSGALRVVQGRVLVANDREEAERKKLSGALGARPNANEAIAYVFEEGLLGGTGSIGGTVDNYGTVEPGDADRSGEGESMANGTLTLRNYAVPSRQPHLVMHPAARLCFKIASASDYDRIDVGGSVKYSAMTQDFSQSDKMPIVEVSLLGGLEGMKAGDELTLLTAAEKASEGEWHFDLKQPDRYTWELVERDDNGRYALVLKLVSMDNSENPDNPDITDDPENAEGTMGALYDDGIDDSADNTPLRDYAAKLGKRVGTALSTWKTDVTNESLAETREAGKQFNMLVAENEMKMETLQPNRGEYSFWAVDNLASFAKRHDMALRGHCLVWHMQQPQWLSSDGKKNDQNWSRTEALKIMEDHITTVVRHFKGAITQWDVVNECLDDDQSAIRTNPDGYTLRQTVWLRAIGEDYIDSAFVYARRADPKVQLFLNDYDVEQQGRAKAVAFRNLAMRLKNKGIPIDGVGLQCHFTVGQVDSVKLDATIRRFGEDGLLCIITELDMGTLSTATKDLDEQARHYRIVTDIALNNDNCTDMVLWGLKDNDSWRSGSSPLLYTASLGKKPAWYAVRSALRHRTLIGTGISSLHPLGPAAHPDGNSKPPYSTAYDLGGRRLDARQSVPKRGIYIVDGKKRLLP